MKKLSKKDEFNRTAYVEILNATADKVKNALGELNTEIEKYNLAISEYNEAAADADEFRDEIVARMEEYAESRSETMEQTYPEWYNEWYEVDLDGLDYVDKIDEPEMEHADLLEQLPSEP